MRKRGWVIAAVLAAASLCAGQQTVEIPADTLRDKVFGGFLGQLLGDLNGLKHEMKYIAEPGDVQQYVPELPDGAWTDDDTDFEWVYVIEMQKNGLLIPNQRLFRAVEGPYQPALLVRQRVCPATDGPGHPPAADWQRRASTPGRTSTFPASS